MTIAGLRFEGPWGHCALVLGFLAFVVWYGLDARAASDDVENLLLIGPACILAALLCVVFLAREVRSLGLARVSGTPDEAGEDFRHRFGVQASIVLLVVYVVVMPWIGFDVATFLFIATGMAIQGERRLWVLLLFPGLVSAAIIYAMGDILFVPVPTLVM